MIKKYEYQRWAHGARIKKMVGENQEHPDIQQFLQEDEMIQEIIMDIILGMVVDKALGTAWRGVQLATSRAQRACRVKKGVDRKICVSEVQLKSWKNKAAILKKINCDDQKKPDYCKQKLIKELEKAAKEIQFHSDNITALKRGFQ